MDMLADLEEIEYVEKPKSLFFAVSQGRSASCMNAVQSGFSPLGFSLTGKGVLVACVDSGIDYTHPDFRNPDGSSRILRFWDQSLSGNPPAGYQIGTEFTKDDLDRILLETDCPYLSPVPHRGERNSSLNLSHVVQQIAEIKHLSCEEVIEQTEQNAMQLFLANQ